MPILNHCLPMRLIKGTDTSKDTVTADAMLEGITAHDANGNLITGIIMKYDGDMSGGLVIVNESITTAIYDPVTGDLLIVRLGAPATTYDAASGDLIILNNAATYNADTGNLII